MPREVTRAAMLSAVRDIAALRCGRTTFVGIDGFGAAGKSSLAAEVQREVPDCVVVPTDWFAAPGVPEWDCARLMSEVLTPLSVGQAGRYRRWDWDRDEPAEWHEVPPGRLIVVEGVSATRRELDVDWALRIWVEAPRDARLARALERDGPQRQELWLARWLPEEQAWADRDPARERADLIVRT